VAGQRHPLMRDQWNEVHSVETMDTEIHGTATFGLERVTTAHWQQYTTHIIPNF